jgi:hypothetical protein
LNYYDMGVTEYHLNTLNGLDINSTLEMIICSILKKIMNHIIILERYPRKPC